MVQAYCATVGFGDIESTNVVGYNTGTSIADNNFVTIPFVGVGYNTADIQTIKISDGGAGGIGYGTETFAIWEGLPTVAEGSEFFYFDPSYDTTGAATDYYWGNDSAEPVSFSIAKGQAVVINCAEDLSVTTAGEVPTAAVSFTTIADNNFSGNPFPSAIDIQNVKISDGGAGGIGYGTETFAIWEGLPTVREGSEFFYFDPSYDTDDSDGVETDYYWGNDSAEKVTFSIGAGQGFVVNCAEGLTITINAPYTLAK